jgi:hypothetical protein
VQEQQPQTVVDTAKAALAFILPASGGAKSGEGAGHAVADERGSAELNGSIREALDVLCEMKGVGEST